MECPECKMLMVNGRCITLGCIHFRWPQYWEVNDAMDNTEEIPIEEGNWLA